MTYAGSFSSSSNSHRPIFDNRPTSRGSNEYDEYNDELQQRKNAQKAENEKAWKSSCAECYDCHELVPHKLLYVCRHKRCYGCYEEKDSKYATPFDFYAREMVFCSTCSFLGNHRHHQEKMEESHPLATELASKNEDFQTQFERLAFLDSEDPVDYMITSEFKIDKLPVIAASEYLLTAGNTAEWSKRKKDLEDFKKTVESCRLEGAKCARRLAEKSLAFYNELAQLVEETTKKDDDREAKKEGDKEKNKRRSGDSGRSSIRDPDSNLEEVPVEPTAPITVKTEEMPPAAPSSDSISPKSEADDSAARMICRNLSLHYDRIRDEMSVEYALQDVSDKLQENSGSDETKMAAAKLFREKHNVALYYPPQQ